ncbi:unnamed protein product [Diabrotica balteata]|uniref:Uncharacterized protein n=1 Tax=Diabrotica balteata TaxID=107213 RepID=A0A9P0DTL9_DIABA|nr:unnamed protein product [Diabrotica balteata]
MSDHDDGHNDNHHDNHHNDHHSHHHDNHHDNHHHHHHHHFPKNPYATSTDPELDPGPPTNNQKPPLPSSWSNGPHGIPPCKHVSYSYWCDDCQQHRRRYYSKKDLV